MRELAIWFLGFVMFTVMFWIISMSEHAECEGVGETTGMPTKYTGMWSGGCYIKKRSGWVPLKNWRAQYDE